MNFISALFHKRTVNKAFNAVDNDNVAELAALKIDPNTTRKAVLEKYTFEWEESLLSRAVRDEKYNVAQYLLDNGADPYSHEYMINDLSEKLRNRAGNLMFQGEQLVDRNGYGMQKDAGVLADPTTDFSRSPVLTMFVALEYARQNTHFPKRFGAITMLGGPNVLDTPRSKKQIKEWLDVQLPRYEAQRLNSHISQTTSHASTRKI